MPVNRSDRLLRLLLPLHEAPHATDTWDIALSGVARLIRCDHVAMIEREGVRVTDAIRFGAASHGAFGDEYRTHWWRLDPIATDQSEARLLRARRAMSMDQLVERATLEQSAFYNDYWQRYGVHGGVVAAVEVTGRRHAALCALHGRSRELQHEDRALFDLFVAHARAALRQRHATLLRDTALRGLLDSTDCLADALFVIDGRGTLMQSNASADDLLARGDIVRLRGGELRLGRCAGADPLADLLAELVAPELHEDTDSVRCLSVRDVADGELLVTAVRMAGIPRADAPAAVIFLRRTGEARPIFRSHHLRDLFGFTPAEARVANALLAGERVEEIAARLGVRADTVRGHVKRMLAKTGTRRQSDLVGRLASAVPSLRALAPAA